MAGANPTGNKTVGPFVVHYDKKLGQGTFGLVYEATYRSNKSTIAVKKMDYLLPGNMNNSFMMDMARKEIKGAMTLNGHPNVVQYLDHFDDGMAFWLGMDYCELGDLDHYLKTHKKNPDLETKMNLMFQCVRGIAFMHSFEPPYVHRDIKLKNFLVHKEHGEDIVKVTDFGVAKFIEDNLGKTKQGSAFLKSFVGTPPFMAPEFFDMDQELKYKANVDVYALGLVFQVLYLYPEAYIGEKDLIPKAVNPEHRFMQIGMYTCSAMKNGWELPEILKIEEKDSTVVKKLKNLIIEMTHHEGKKRKELWLVQTELEELINDRDKTPEATKTDPEEKVSDKDLKNTLPRDSRREDAIIASISESYITRLMAKDADNKKGESKECKKLPDERKLAWEPLPSVADEKSKKEKPREVKDTSDITSEIIPHEPDEESVDVSHGAEEPNYDIFSKPGMDFSEMMYKVQLPDLKKSPSSKSPSTGVKEKSKKSPQKTHSPPYKTSEDVAEPHKYDVTNIQDFKSLKDIMKEVEKQFEEAGIKPETPSGQSGGTKKKTQKKKPPKAPPKPQIIHPADVSNKPETSHNDGKKDDALKAKYAVTHYKDFKPLKDRVAKLYEGK